jgi:hypothetical protein
VDILENITVHRDAQWWLNREALANAAAEAEIAELLGK